MDGFLTCGIFPDTLSSKLLTRVRFPSPAPLLSREINGKRLFFNLPTCYIVLHLIADGIR